MLVVRCVLLATVLFSACRQVPPEERIDRLRSRFTATASSMTERRPSETATAGGEPLVVVEGAGPRSTTILLDVVLTSTARSTLAGLTLDVSQVDAKGESKEVRRLFVDTSRVRPGNDVQATLVLDHVSYEDGDQFAAEVRSPIAAAERGAYREYAPSG